MGFLEEMADTLPAAKKAEFLERVQAMDPEEYQSAEEAARALYTSSRINRDLRNMQAAVRYNYADRLPQGRAATRRRKQLERQNVQD